MSRDHLYSPPTDPQQVAQLQQVIVQCFNSTAERTAEYLAVVGPENFRLIQQGTRVAGGLAIHWMGQWFGGRVVPMAGLASVGIAPEYRGAGLAARLLTDVIGELHEKNIPLSALYPATQRLYRKVGYEQAGHRVRYAIAPRDIGLADRTLAVHAVDALDHSRFKDLYQELAREQNGVLDRSAALWTFATRDRGAHWAYLFGPEETPEGYVVFRQQAGQNAYEVLISDWAVRTPRAARRLWTLLADHSSQASRICWSSGASDWLVLALPEQTWEHLHWDRWMLRIVDVVGALSARGWPPGVTGELHLAVSDDLIPDNNGCFVLTVADGRTTVEPGGRGDLKTDIAGLAPLYSGLFTAHQLQTMGKIDASSESLAVADRLFAGPQPWMLEHF